MTYIKLFVDYLDAIEPLGDAERGRLFTALLQYGRTGEAPQLGGNERFIFPMMRAQIDRQQAEAEEVSEARREAGKRGAEAKKAKQASVSKSKQIKQEQANVNFAKQNKQIPDLPDKPLPPFSPPSLSPPHPPNPNPPISPLPVTPQSPPEDGKTYGFGCELYAAFTDWLAYKQEKRQGYKPTGLKSLVTQIQKHAKTHGEAAVAALIRECMACNWQGIIWDRLAQQGTQPERDNIFMQIAREEGIL